MTRPLDLADIQGNLLRAYAAHGFLRARYFFLHVDDRDPGRHFVGELQKRVTTAQRWSMGSASNRGAQGFRERPKVTVNIAFTFRGLDALGLPTRTLRAFPAEFIDGMPSRAHILGDVGGSAPERWDRVWRESIHQGADADVHAWVSMNALVNPDGTACSELSQQTDWLRELCRRVGGVRLVAGHGPDQRDFQEAAAHLEFREGIGAPTGKEHFGYADGFGNPVFEGQYAPEIERQTVVGRGKLMPDGTWKPLAVGELLLGHPDESQGLPSAAPPWEFTRNGSFLVYRKLHQNVAAFANYVDTVAAKYAEIMGVGAEEAAETIKAKMVGRWTNGVPLSIAPTYDEWIHFNSRWAGRESSQEYRSKLMDFRYRDDLEGFKCPVASHIRRTNSRDMLDPQITSSNPADWAGSALNKRRRILRRGLPYGSFDQGSDDCEQGVIFMALCASIFRQFEFVQQQWIHYGLDFNVGNDTCPITGNHDEKSKFVIASDPKTGKPPFVCPSLPQFVTTRGGDYFFLPSMTALSMIAQGAVDPT